MHVQLTLIVRIMYTKRKGNKDTSTSIWFIIYILHEKTDMQEFVR